MPETTNKPAKKQIRPIDIINNENGVYTKDEIKRAWVGLLSTQPPKSWIKERIENNKSIPYLPIERSEQLMDKLLMFPSTKITNSGMGTTNVYNKKTQQFQQKTLAFMNIELRYYNHGIDDWVTTSGTASMEVAGGFSFELIFPKLKAEAYKNACKSIGNIFGRRLGRDDMVMTDADISIRKTTKAEIKPDRELLIKQLKDQDAYDEALSWIGSNGYGSFDEVPDDMIIEMIKDTAEVDNGSL
ncbi:MAG: hypothetical protein IKT33_03420 [Clostridia bacterium]|nr:hypothetical protein [Clostridia bacterium]